MCVYERLFIWVYVRKKNIREFAWQAFFYVKQSIMYLSSFILFLYSSLLRILPPPLTLYVRFISYSFTSLFLICIDNVRWNKMFIYIGWIHSYFSASVYISLLYIPILWQSFPFHASHSARQKRGNRLLIFDDWQRNWNEI